MVLNTVKSNAFEEIASSFATLKFRICRQGFERIFNTPPIYVELIHTPVREGTASETHTLDLHRSNHCRHSPSQLRIPRKAHSGSVHHQTPPFLLK